MPEWLTILIVVIVATPLIYWFWPGAQSAATKTRPPRSPEGVGWGSPSGDGGGGGGGGGGDGGGGGQ
jgi:uncharacterized membrane protein YgcG